MTHLLPRAATALFLVALGACQPTNGNGGDAAGAPASESVATDAPTPIASATSKPGESAAFAAVGRDEAIRLVGTEPFWGGTVEGDVMVYSTLENQQGDSIAVRRFAGNSGLGFSGTWQGAPLDLTITAGTCSDGMSDRSFPFTATLKLGQEQRNGCAWTDRTPFTGSPAP